MKIDKIDVKLPKKEDSVRNFFLSCEKRKKLVEDIKGHHAQHLKKAKHDLSRAIAEFQDNCWDWTIVKAYYAIHHAGNALLSKNKCMFSKDHSCLVIALKHWDLINNEFFDELIELHEKFSDIFSLDLTFQLRKISQYDVDEWENLSKDDAKLILDVAKRFIKFVEGKV